MTAPVMALLPDLGLVTATLQASSIGGFGLDFGLSFGDTTAVGAVTATLAGTGVSTATTSEVLVTAQIQLV